LGARLQDCSALVVAVSAVDPKTRTHRPLRSRSQRARRRPRP
jgi:hypothetical protein